MQNDSNDFVTREDSPQGVRFRARPGVRNICLEISYRGEGFMGYQSQPHGVTVQDTLFRAWEVMTKESTTLYGCSRLDAGVHANQYFVNLYTRSERSLEDIFRALNGILRTQMRASISIYNAKEVEPDFNARFDTLGKHYRYRLWYGRGHHAAHTPAAWQVRSRTFDTQTLTDSLSPLIGLHDFAAFRASDCTAKTTVRKIERIDVWCNAHYPEAITIDVWGEGFLKNMVRNIVGTAVDVAIGKLCSSTTAKALVHLDRTQIGQCAPAHALTLQRVFYESQQWNAALSGHEHSFL